MISAPLAVQGSERVQTPRKCQGTVGRRQCRPITSAGNIGRYSNSDYRISDTLMTAALRYSQPASGHRWATILNQSWINPHTRTVNSASLFGWAGSVCARTTGKVIKDVQPCRTLIPQPIRVNRLCSKHWSNDFANGRLRSANGDQVLATPSTAACRLLSNRRTARRGRLVRPGH